MLTTQEMAAAMQVALEDVQQELGLPINGQKPIEDATTPNQYREALEKSHAFNEHLKTCSNNCFQKRAVKDATKEVEAGKAKLAQERTTVYLAQRRPSCMLYCKTLELKEAAFDYLTANHSWLSCERAPLPCDFDCYGLLPTWWFMFLMLLFGVLLLSLVLLLSFNGLVFGGALILRYFICDQPLPDLSLGADHAAEEWTGTGAFCGTTGILNTLLVDLEGSFGPVLICLLFADCFVLYLCFLVIKAALGEISETRLMVHVAYCACVFEILAVTLGILSGGHLGKMIEAWTGNGFAGMMSLFGERSEASARYFTYYILLRVFILIPALKLNRSALHASDLLRLLSWFIGGICMIIACPVATVLSWLFPTRCPGGARHAFDRVWTAMDSTVAFIANWAAYVLLWVLALVVALICVGCVVPLVAWLVWAIKRAAENCTEDGFCFELAYTVYCDFQKTCWTLRRWASVPGSKVAPLIAIGGHDDNAHGGSAHFHAHEYIGIVAMLVYYPGVAYSATAVVVTATSAGFQLQLAAVICFLVSYQQAEGNPSLGLWTVCSVQCRVWAGLLRLLVTAAMVMHKGLAPLECLPLLVAAVLYIIACLMLIYPALRKLEELPDREAAAWANRLGIVPKQEVARQCYVFPCMRALRRFTASMGSAASRIMQTTTDDEGSSAAAMEEGLAGPGRSPLANLTNSPAQRRGGHKALTFELY